MERVKVCTKCGKEKPFEEYYRYYPKSSTRNDAGAFFSHCKECHKKHTREYYQAHRERCIESSSIRYRKRAKRRWY